MFSHEQTTSALGFIGDVTGGIGDPAADKLA
jgi:hypothetical protein